MRIFPRHALLAVGGNYMRQAVLALQELKPDYVIPMHCSGAKFSAALQKHMPEALVLSSTGGRFTFGV